MPAKLLSHVHALNQHPLNQAAKRWLRQARAEVSEEHPYLLQLMWWGLEESDLGMTPESKQRLRARLLPVVEDLLRSPNKEAVQRYLFRGSEQGQPDDPHLSLQSLQNAQDPKDAAWRALDSLNDLVGADPNRDPAFLPD